MPSNPRKTSSGQRNKVTASARARVSIKKICKKNQNQEGSFLQAGMIGTSSPSSPQPSSSTTVQGNNDMVLAMLYDIKASNQALPDRMTKLEQQSLVPPPIKSYPQPQVQVMGSSHEPQPNSMLPHIHHKP